MRWLLLLGFAVGCARVEKTGPAPAASASPAPISSLAVQLGANDAGRGTYEIALDGPYCMGHAPRIDRTRPLGSRAEPTRAPLMAASDGSFGFYAVTGEPPAQSVRSDVRFVLSGPAHVKAGTTVHLEPRIDNQSAAAIQIAHVVDGSIWRWRWPFVETFLQEVGQATTYVWSHGPSAGRCGNVDPRSSADYTAVLPATSAAEPFGPHGSPLDVTIDRIGHYRIWSVYVACEGVDFDLGHGSDPDPPRPADLVTGPLVSNVIDLEITGE